MRYSDERRILRYQIEFGFTRVERPGGFIRHSVSMVRMGDAIRI